MTKLEEVIADLRNASGVDERADGAELDWTRAKVAQLEVALEHRTVLGQATGLVMTRYGLSSDAAFHVLARLSQDLNRKATRSRGRW